MTSDISNIREHWEADQPKYEEMVNRVRCVLELEIRNMGMMCVIEGRTKDMGSLLKKAMKPKYKNPYDEITDKAGVRVVIPYLSQVEPIGSMISNRFDVVGYEDKRSNLSPNELGYLGVHYEVHLLEADLENENDRCNGLICEIQLHTRAQNVWSDLEHDLIYKPTLDPPSNIKRGIFRLVSLIELFDIEMGRYREEIMGLPQFRESQVLAVLEPHYDRLGGLPYDRELSIYILDAILALYSGQEIETFEIVMGDFVRKNSSVISGIYGRYQDDTGSVPLLFQPEALVIFERLERASTRLALRAKWGSILPVEELQRLATTFGKSI